MLKFLLQGSLDFFSAMSCSKFFRRNPVGNFPALPHPSACSTSVQYVHDKNKKSVPVDAFKLERQKVQIAFSYNCIFILLLREL